MEARGWKVEEMEELREKGLLRGEERAGFKRRSKIKNSATNSMVA